MAALLLLPLVAAAAALAASASAAAAAAGETMRVVAVQHSTVYPGPTPRDSIVANMKQYAARVEQVVAASSSSASEEKPALFVFPEIGLGHNEAFRWDNAKYGEELPTGVNPREESTWVDACAQPAEWQRARPALTLASCTAKKHGVAMVYGCIDTQPCTPGKDHGCRDDGVRIFNSAVAVDEQGRLKAVMHKYHIFFSLTGVFDIPSAPQPTWFTLANGTPVGIVICFGSMFPDPVLPLVELGIKTFAFATSWTNAPPVLLATTWQQAWSRRFGATFISANNAASVFSSGGSICVDGDIRTAFFNHTLSGSADERVLVAEVPVQKPIHPVPSDAIITTTTPALDASTTPLPTPQQQRAATGGLCGTVPGDCEWFRATPGSSGKVSASDGKLSCAAAYNVSAHSPATSGDSTLYALLATSSWVWFSQWVQVQLCSVLRCRDDLVCVILDPDLHDVYQGALFDSLTISGGPFEKDTYIFPMATANEGQILPKKAVQYSPLPGTGSHQLTIAGEGLKTPLISTSLFGRVWKKE